MSTLETAPVRCAICEYLLTGLPETGACPECAYPIDESIRHRGGWTARRVRILRWACGLFVGAWVPWFFFGVALASLPTPSLRVMIACCIAAHAGLIGSAMLLATAACSVQTAPRRLLLMALFATPMLACGVIIGGAVTGMVQLSRSAELLLIGAGVARALVALITVWWLVRADRSLEESNEATPRGGARRAVAGFVVGAILFYWLVTFGLVLSGQLTGFRGSPDWMAFGALGLFLDICGTCIPIWFAARLAFAAGRRRAMAESLVRDGDRASPPRSA
jgi:hypothetical protein